MSDGRPLTVLCVATFEKGHEFLRECRRQGCRVLLLTLDTLAEATWPREAVDDIFYMRKGATPDDFVKGVSHLARTERLDRIVALDDFDVETAALLREHLRVPGMGETTARYFRDKLAMRVRARNAGIRVPAFVAVVNDQDIRAFLEQVPPPWVLKPRSQAAAIGIRKLHHPDGVWQAIEGLGDRRSFHVLEAFVSGDVYHVDAIVWDRDVPFAVAHRYGAPPMQVAHEGGIFVTTNLPPGSADRHELLRLNRDVLQALGYVRGVSHTEFIRGSHDGAWYFLETSARVGGAHIVELVEAATGINLWREWARLEIAGEHGHYVVPPHRERAAGLVLSLARQETPDTSGYVDPEITFRVTRPHHAGLIVASDDRGRIEALVAEYVERFRRDFYATAPPLDSPTS